jgi:hypothetical protein
MLKDSTDDAIGEGTQSPKVWVCRNGKTHYLRCHKCSGYARAANSVRAAECTIRGVSPRSLQPAFRVQDFVVSRVGFVT